MKLMWFHLMPYTELPEDFREANPSVWVDIHSSLFDPKRAHHMYNDFMDELEYAADVGFDAVCVNEHHSNGYGLMPSPNLIASSLARRTTDTAICVMGNSLALYNPPTRVAEEFAMIDCISGGRLIAGFPVGTPMDTCYAYGTNPSQLRQRYHEAHDLVVRAWTEQDTFAFNGRFNQQRYVNIWPRPVQQPHPPIWVPGGGSVETWQLVRRDGLRLLLSVATTATRPAAPRWTVSGPKWTGWARTATHITPASCNSSASAKAASTPSTCTPRPPNISTAAACMSIRDGPPRPATPAKAASAPASKARSSKAADANVRGKSTGERFASVAREMDAIVDNGYVIIGSPDEVAEQLREVAVNLNVGHLMLLLQYGNMSKDLTRYNTQTVRGTGHAEAEGRARRLGRPLVAEADGKRRERAEIRRVSSPRLAAE